MEAAPRQPRPPWIGGFQLRTPGTPGFEEAGMESLGEAMMADGAAYPMARNITHTADAQTNGLERRCARLEGPVSDERRQV